MANMQERRNKEGKLISFSVRVYRGRDAAGKQLKPHMTSFKVQPQWSEALARKKAEAFAAVYENEIKQGHKSSDKRCFEDYCAYVLGLKETRETIKRTTDSGYRYFTKRIYPEIGHIRLTDLRAEDLNNFYTKLSKPGMNLNTGGKLSGKTILEYHRFISSILSQAKKEQLIPYNVAEFAEVPKRSKPEVKYFQPEEIAAIREALEHEKPKWKALVHLLLLTGARRGEVCTLRWDDILFEQNKINISRNLLYTAEHGIYTDNPKSEQSERCISVPDETMDLLRKYKIIQDAEIQKLDGYYTDYGYLFTQENGKPMNPKSVTGYLAKFSKKHGLPHISPHMFRHTMASMLYYKGVDSVTISSRLGHAQTSTTTDLYAHVIQAADKENAAYLADIFLKKEKSRC